MDLVEVLDENFFIYFLFFSREGVAFGLGARGYSREEEEMVGSRII